VKYLIVREGRVRFSEPVREHHVELRIAPWDDDWQRLCSCALDVDPAAESATHRDGFGNLVYRFAVMGSHSRLVTRFQAEVETLLTNPFELDALPPAREREWIADSLRQAPRLWDFVLHRGPLTPALPASVGDVELPELTSGSPVFDQVQSSMNWIGELCQHDVDSEEPRPIFDGLLETRRGGAADMAHFLIAIVRAWGLPARYAVGYVDPRYFEPDEDAENGEPRPQVMHSWAEVLIPGAGWRGFDPAFGLLVDETYVRVAVGRDAMDVVVERSSNKGQVEPPQAEVALAVTPLS
jgi:transglutaminase-like putative cysteine protease